MEYWDIYDVNKQPTGRTMQRNDWHMKDGDYHLTVLGVICRPDGRYLITRRNADKSWAPLCWEVPGGGVRAGESSADAVIREVREETGLDISGYVREPALTYRRDNPEEGDNYFVDVYRIEMDYKDSMVTLQEKETCGFMSADLEDIRRIAGEGKFLHYDSIMEVF